MNTTLSSSEPPDLRLKRAVDLLTDCYSKNHSYSNHIRSHWLSTFLIIAYGFVAYIYSPEFLVVFLGLVTIVFAVEAERYSSRSRENKHLEESLREIINLLEAQALANKRQADKGEQGGTSNGG
jgi:hypothetical protein